MVKPSKKLMRRRSRSSGDSIPFQTRPCVSGARHSSAALTLDRYSHLYDDDLEALADALEERFAHTDVAQVWPKPPGELVDLASRTARS